MTITIIHNPRCSKSRLGVKYLEEKGVEFKIREYLKDNLTRKELEQILSQLDIKPINLIRKKEKDYKELLKINPNPTDQELINRMIEYPKLIERPIVVNEKTKKAVVARPTEEIEKVL